MYLQKLQLLNFKNYEEIALDFASKVNVLVGRNGSGKTNLLDAIYYLSFTKSAFATSDLHCVRKGESFLMVKAAFKKNNTVFEVSSAIQSGQKKVFREGGNEYQKLSDHIGRFPVIMIAPDDVDIIKEGSEARRRFFDSAISQLDKEYLNHLIVYNNALKQRNSLLKMFADSGRPDWLAIESYDRLLVQHGEAIYTRRKRFCDEYLPVFRKYFNFLVNEAETSTLAYESGVLTNGFQEQLVRNRQRDLVMQRTNFGVHRDDYIFSLGEGDLKRLGSQGQQKSFVIALKLAQFEILEQHNQFKPILLLDDIFDKLDDQRITKLLELIRSDLGQLFITDARPGRTKDLLDAVGVEATVLFVDAGRISVGH
ncbi:DNA replication/repair protein RecF [Pseudochryseolinea flava]|uniref:DNA replication and repair protein RecF n=1 Tax=Pseudochryseolinea flava TaxID=2059302 RepID=A0A364XZY9_9BACT|nr:DNA replication/repair protein RecF [Pseudochryseolinea flava]RAV99369.1 DNA replication and repair protein RecF [Pseudochryseolinea flava]